MKDFYDKKRKATLMSGIIQRKNQISDVEKSQNDYALENKEEGYTLKKNNLESAKSLKEASEQNKLLENENMTLKDQVKDLEEKIKRSSALLKKIYNSIPKK